MPVLVPALPVMPVAATPPAATENAPTADSGADFQTTLSSALAQGQTADAAGELKTPKDPAEPDVSASIDMFAAGGNPLPPVLPPVLPPEAAALPALAVVLEFAATTAVGTDKYTNASAEPESGVGQLDNADRPAAALLDVATLRALRLKPEVVSATSSPASARAETPSAPVPTFTLPAQLEAATKAETGADAGKPSILDSMARLASATTAADVTAAPTMSAPGLHLVAPASEPLAVSAPTAVTVPVAFGQAGWGQAMSQQVVWAVNQNLPSAELHLSPPDLGPVSVRISVDADQAQASISFAAGHGAVREAIEAALPRLRDMLSTQGIALTDVNVSSHENFHQAQREPGAREQAGAHGDGGHDEPVIETRAVARMLRILDTYA